MRKSLLFFILLFTSIITVSADKFCLDGIYYNILNEYNKTVEVTYVPIDEGWVYSGSIQIPSAVEHDGIKYSVISIGYAAFEKSNITSVTIPSSVKTIGTDAFFHCSSLTAATIPSGVEDIKNSAFSYCSNLTYIEIPRTVSRIRPGTFYNCFSLKSITIPNTVQSVAYDAFEGCYFTKANFKNYSSLTESFYGATIVDTEQDDGLLLKGTEVMRCRAWATEVTIPSSATEIGVKAFADCPYLASVVIPTNIKTIKKNAFENSCITSITIPSSVTTLEDGIFQGCRLLTTVNLPSSLTAIGSSAFYRCTSLESINIPINVAAIGSSAFYGCTSLLSINIPSSVTVIEKNTFDGCTSLTSVSIPTSVTMINDNAFKGCSLLKSITIPSSVLQIGYNSFEGCYFTTENFQNNSIVSGSFGAEIVDTELSNGLLIRNDYVVGCRSYATVVDIPLGIKGIYVCIFMNCPNLTSVTIPSSVTMIGKECFAYCRNLKSVDIAHGVTNIEVAAFGSCSSLSAITIPSSVTVIKAAAFDYCISLESVTNYATIPQTIYESTFEVYGTLHVLPGCKSAYEAAEYWKNFTIVEDAILPAAIAAPKGCTVCDGVKYTIDGRIINGEPEKGTVYIMDGNKYIK